MKIDSVNARSIMFMSILVSYFSLITWLPISYYNAGYYDPVLNGLTNFFIFVLYIVSAVWVMFNIRKGNRAMLLVSVVSVISFSIIFFDMFVFSIVG